MKSINKILRPNNNWFILLLVLIVVIYTSALLRYRIDLTAEKRFSLNQSTKKLLGNLDSTVNITLFLTGDLPADYKKLSIATNDLLAEFRDIRHNNIHFHFEKPGENLPDSERMHLYDSLQRLGVVFEQNNDVSTGSEKSTQQLIIPSAIIEYGDYYPVTVDLRSSRTVFKNYNVVNDEPQEDKEATLNAAEALLEYKFANAIDKLTRKNIPMRLWMWPPMPPDATSSQRNRATSAMPTTVERIAGMMKKRNGRYTTNMRARSVPALQT